MPYSLSIPSTTLSSPPDSASKPFTLYNLTITTPLRTTIIPKRYSDFDTLHAALTSSTGAAPPKSLPSKSWFTRTINNPALTEDRRVGLETYISAIESDKDQRWRESSAWRAFLNFPPTTSRRNSSFDETAKQLPTTLSPSAWLDLHATLKAQLQEARSFLAKREVKDASIAQAHEAGASAKRCLVKSNTLIIRLEEGLKNLGVGEGEIRRRRDLVARARKEREGLEALLNAWAVTKGRAGSTNGASDSQSGSFSQKKNLFSRISPSSSPGKIPGAWPTRGGRVLGGPAKETNRTRDKDNQEVLQLQQKIMQEQDMDVNELAQTVRRMKELGVAINEELAEQVPMLDIFDQDTDRVGAKIGVAKKRIRKLG